MENLAWVLLAAIASGFGGYVGAYLKKKGENLATHEDLDKLVEQIKATTDATKRIEDQISQEAWDRQRHWEMKRDAVIAAIQALLACKHAITICVAMLKTLKDAGIDPRTHVRGAEEATRFNQAISELEAKHLITQLTCSQEFWKCLWDAKVIIGNFGSAALRGEAGMDGIFPKSISIATSKALELARRELGR